MVLWGGIRDLFFFHRAIATLPREHPNGDSIRLMQLGTITVELSPFANNAFDYVGWDFSEYPRR